MTPRSSKTGTTRASVEARVRAAAEPRAIKPTQRDAFEPNLGASLTGSIIGGILIAALLACSMYVPLNRYSVKIRENLCMSCRFQKDVQRRLITGLVTERVTPSAHDGMLTAIVDMVYTYVRAPPDKAIDVMWTKMQVERHLGMDPSPPAAPQREALAFQAYAALSQQWRANIDPRLSGDEVIGRGEHRRTAPHAEQLYVAYSTGDFLGIRLVASSTCGYSSVASDGDDHDSTASDCQGEIMDLGNGSQGNRARRVYRMSEATGDRVGPPRIDPPDYEAVERPYYYTQFGIRARAQMSLGGLASVPARRAWTPLYLFTNGAIGISWTAPIAHCGNYSCFEGVIGSDITLNKITNDCTRHWEGLRTLLNRSKMVITPENSAVFIVNRISRRFTRQEGVVIGASNSMDALDGTLTLADNSTESIVRTTSIALRQNFHGSWDHPDLNGRFTMTYKRSKLLQKPPMLESCATQDFTHEDYTSGDCFEVATLAVQMDQDTSWLVVSTLPLGAFTANAAENARNVDSTQDEIEEVDKQLFLHGRMAGVVVFMVVSVLSIVLGFALNQHLVPPLRRLSTLMERLYNLDFAHGTPEFEELRNGQTCRIRDIGKLQRAFYKLSRAIEAFSRFVPEPVVLNIVRGDEKATRLHVNRRQVTTMFTHISDFAALCQDLPHKDVLFILTCYFNLMTRIVEHYNGVIAEILTDGLLVFWNTPQLEADHVSKALSAALEQERAIGLLNKEFRRMGLPVLRICSGVHTGPTLTGNLGSDVKMKFGCLGDAVNLASRLEGLCAHYGVNVICSAATYSTLPVNHQFFCRKLDLVQVKGKKEPIVVLEVIERDARTSHGRSAAIGSQQGRRSRALLYEEALRAFQNADFQLAISLAEAVLEEDPGDRAAAQLRERAAGHDAAGITDEERENWTGVLKMVRK